MRKKINSLKQVDGKFDGKTKVKSLDDLFGYHMARYKTSDAKEYVTRLKEMNKIDLQKECIRVGLLPNDNRAIMEERLAKEHARYVSTAVTRDIQPIVLKVSKEAMNILAESANKPS